MKKAFGFFALLGVGVVLFYWVVTIIGWEDILVVLGKFSGTKGISILFLSFLILVIGSFRWQRILHHQGHPIGFLKLFQPYLGGFSLSFFAPMFIFGNEFFRAYTVQEMYNVPFAKGMASSIIERILEGTLYLLVFVLGLSFLLFSSSAPIPVMLLVIIMFVVLFGAAIAFFYFKSFRGESILSMLFPGIKRTNHILEIEKEVFHFFTFTKRAFWEGVLLSFFKVLVMLLRVWLLAVLLGESIGLAAAISILGFSYLALLVPIPAALGSHDVLQAFSFQFLGIGAQTGVAFAFLIRTADILFALLGLVFLLHLGAFVAKSIVFKKAERLFRLLPFLKSVIMIKKKNA